MPPAKKSTTTEPSAPTADDVLVEIAAIVRHPEAAEHGGRNRYKREALVQIAELTKDVVVPGESEPEPEAEDIEEETEPDEAA